MKNIVNILYINYCEFNICIVYQLHIRIYISNVKIISYVCCISYINKQCFIKLVDVYKFVVSLYCIGGG